MSALLFSYVGSAATAADYASLRASGGDSVMSRWRDYALSSITPQFSWAALPPASTPPRVLDRYGARIETPVLFKLSPTSTTRVSLGVASGVVSDTPARFASGTASDLGVPQGGVERTVVTPSLIQRWDNGDTLKLSAVLAYQRFASLGLGLSQLDGTARPPTWADAGNTSYGAGARLDVGGPISDRLRWGVAYQSRVGMDSFANYRGVYSDAGDFDIPASASVDLGYALTPSFGVDFGAQRVMYSAIRPFTSPSLPTRFLALLGDSASPVFAWRDLTVYSIGWTYRTLDAGSLELRYTTRQQPLPTSLLLENALKPYTADDTVSLGWSRALSVNSHVSFAASYASSSYLLMMPAYNTHDNSTASQVEFEAMWSVRF